jgi:GNAT superfamily N-acetyltransferase
VGLYVNRAMGIGADRAVDDGDLDVIVSRSRALGVPPAVEVTPCTLPETLDRLRASGFVHDPTADVTAFVRDVTGRVDTGAAGVVVRQVRTAGDVALWQEVSAVGWGHRDTAARRASDAYVVAAHAIDGDGMMIAFDAATGAPIGCASVTVRDGIATLGGMSTDPAHRRRGVQTALVSRRLRFAAERGCDVAAATTRTESASERNLVRWGFSPAFTIATWTM